MVLLPPLLCFEYAGVIGANAKASPTFPSPQHGFFTPVASLKLDTAPHLVDGITGQWPVQFPSSYNANE